MSNRGNPFRRYSYEQLSDQEREAVHDCYKVGATRMAVGVGVALTSMALIGQMRRGRRPLPTGLRYGFGGLFTLVSGYAGLQSGGHWYVSRMLSVPNSKFADELRVYAGEWESTFNLKAGALIDEEIDASEAE